ncbi:MAG: excinuclease ABC subunit UvrC, partial [Oscillospiraceae bacterium]|nr:excinuclease ABC subunit UvrC [Oscillospiraceae bacterium]
VLENALIKQYMPRYNILLKDDKGYPFVRLSREAYPKFSIVSRVCDDGARYFGPYGMRQETRSALDAIRAALRLPTCSRTFPRDIGKERPCLNHHMGRCDGFCRKEMTEEEYNRRIELAVQLLEGKVRLVTARLMEEMEAAAAELRFEEAAVLRDRVNAIKVLTKRQKVLAGVCADTDVWGLYLGAKCCYAVLHYEDGQLTGREAELFSASALDDPAEILSALLLQYYGGRSVLPREICLPAGIEDQEVLEQLLTEKAGRRTALRVPQRGERAQVLQMAETNAREEAERQTSSQERTDKTLELLGRLMGLPEPPEWMESYDISNTGADDIVASMVVFHGSRPAKDRYRRFRIRGLDGHPDDYKSMEEVLTRRLTHYMEQDKKFMPLPDVLLIDGGEQHAKVARRVTERFGLAIPVFGMVKDDRHRTRALVTPEGREIGVKGTQAVFALIGRIQEETHRFAITFNRESHGKSVRGSTLDAIPGVGEVRRSALLKRFKSLKAIREASLEELQAVVPKNTAAAVYQWAHSAGDE